MDIIKYMKHLDSCLMERIEDFENLGQSPKCDCGLEEAIQQVKLFATPAVVGRGEQLCQHDRSVTNRICDDCGSVITYVPNDKLA